ncbi:MAG: FGGY-family carbohydrate kinase [Ruthenibacterium sp.]
MQTVAEYIQTGKAILGMELGSTRIKAVLIGEHYAPITSGTHEWENRCENGVWTYHLEDVWAGIADAYAKLCAETVQKYGVTITKLAGIGFSAMMHGYLAFDKDDIQLAPFRTWRNTMTQSAAEKLTQAMQFNIPQRWSVAHLYGAVLNDEAHVDKIDFLTTLAGAVHWKLTGEKVIGIGDASGMFPIDSTKNDYDMQKITQFDALVADKNYAWTLRKILPKVLVAGQNAGALTAAGAALLDPSGNLQAGIPMCPPEGDAGTGMTATNSVAPRTGNVSAGTSIFAMLSRVYPEIDMVTTPSGKPVAMVHCNNCTSDLDAWVKLFKELNAVTGATISTAALYDALYAKALEGDADCGGVLSYNYFSGEPVTGFDAGRPLLVRTQDSRFNLANFMRAQLFAAMGSLKIGMDILFEKEQITLDKLYGHGGLFKTKMVGQRLMAAAMHTPVAVMETAGEGGAWGIALLAAFCVNGQKQSLEAYLASQVFGKDAGIKIAPDAADVRGFEAYMQRYTAGLAIEKAAVAAL